VTVPVDVGAVVIAVVVDVVPVEPPLVVSVTAVVRGAVGKGATDDAGTMVAGDAVPPLQATRVADATTIIAMTLRCGTKGASGYGHGDDTAPFTRTGHSDSLVQEKVPAVGAEHHEMVRTH
jgi:hypothetical protein